MRSAIEVSQNRKIIMHTSWVYQDRSLEKSLGNYKQLVIILEKHLCVDLVFKTCLLNLIL